MNRMIEEFDGDKATCQVTKEQFQCYVDIQHSGVINMMDISNIQKLSKMKKVPLTKEDCFYIMKNYIALATLYEVY